VGVNDNITNINCNMVL